MDVLQTPTVWIGNRCYRKSYIEATSYRNCPAEDATADAQICDNYFDETCDTGINIESKTNGYHATLKCPKVFFGLIIGKRGGMKKKIESETRTQIQIPQHGQDGDIEIFGIDRAGVGSAHTRITVLIEAARHRQPFTHFISIPVVNPSIQTKFEEFKEEVLKNCQGEEGIDTTLFQNRNKLHITIGTLTLLDGAEIAKASKLLEECCTRLISIILDGCPLLVNIHGLEYMNDDPNAVDVLYAKLTVNDGSERLQALADALVDNFVSAGLMERQYDRVKLHITIMNTLFRRERTTSHTIALPKDRECFDARKVLKLYGDYGFGSLHIGSIHLSQRQSTSPDGYYAADSSITLP